MRSKDSIFRICFRGIYSCYWSQSKQSKRRWACCWFSFLSLVSILSLGWMYVCFVAYNDHNDANWMIFTKLGKWVNWYMIVIILSAILAIYCLLLLLFSFFQFAIREPLNLHCLHKVLLFVGLLLVLSCTVGFSLEWKDEWSTVRLSLQATAPFLQLAMVAALTMISWLVFESYHRAQSAVSKFLMLWAFVAVAALIFLSPLMITSPCLNDKLPPKPGLVAHRGAPTLAPENTIMSFRKSAECNVTAFETDVQLSKDKTPFLMHDTDRFLQRTTNVTSDQKYNKSSDITFKELRNLNAGEWFIKNDPFWSVSLLSEKEKAHARNEKVPSLSELLELAKEYNISVIFDLKDNSSEDNCEEIVSTIRKSNISENLIWWLPPNCTKYIKNKKPSPRFRYVYDNKTEMESDNGNFLNLRYNKSPESLRNLINSNVTVNLWVVNERWLFSLLWCMGASSVTTNTCHIFKDMSRPDWHLKPYVYKIIWIVADFVSVLLMVILFLFQRQKHSSRQVFLSEGERSVPLLRL